MLTREITRNRVVRTILLGGLLAALAAPALAEKTVLRLWLRGPVGEAPSEDAELLALLGGEPTRTLHQWVAMIEDAAESADVDGLVLIIDSFGAGLAQVEELRTAIGDFKAAGKPVFAYCDYAGNGGYALATAADHITLAEHSGLDIMGLRAEVSFYKKMFDKIGVTADMLHCGDYKSAVEPFTRTEPSQYAAEQMNRILDGIFDELVGMMAEGRGLSKEQIEGAIDRAPVLAQDALDLKLVDAVAGFPAFREMIRKEFGQDLKVVKSLDDDDGLDIDFENPFAFFQIFQDLMEEAQREPEPGVALIYVDGGISTGKSQSGMGGTVAGSTTVRSALVGALENDNVKAVVLRVDSPGGSALASDIMWDAATRLGKTKPLIVSMGNVAGSGGYYVSIPGDVIFADASTITGSIGVLGGKLVWSDLWEEKIGITTTEYVRGGNAGMFSMNHGFSESERTALQQMLDTIYAQFKGRVMASRGERIKGELEDLAGGRVYTGRQALEIGLVDRIGTLSDAIAYAAEKAGLGDDPEVFVLPKEKDFMEVLLSAMGEDTRDEFEITMRDQVLSDPMLRAMLPVFKELCVEKYRALAHDWLNISIIQRENVGCFMPFSGRLR